MDASLIIFAVFILACVCALVGLLFVEGNETEHNIYEESHPIFDFLKSRREKDFSCFDKKHKYLKNKRKQGG